MAVNDAVEGCESFDWTDTLSQRYVLGGTLTTQVAVSTANPRSGSRCFVLNSVQNNTAYAKMEGLPARTARYFHLGFRLESDNELVILTVTEGATGHLSLKVNARVLSVIFGSGAAAVTATGSLNLNQWYSIKVFFSIHDTTGRARVKVNATTVLDFTGDTRNGATGVQDQFWLGQTLSINGANVVNYRIDDVAWMNGDHADATDFDDVRVDYLAPTSAGDSTVFTPSAGANWQNVDEVPPDEDTTYNDAMAVNDLDRYNLPGISNPGFIYGVEHVMRARKTDAGNGNFRGQLKVGVSTTNVTDRALNTTYQSFFEFVGNVPGGTGWTETNVADLLVAFERTL